jgi:hypothetical protein
MFGEVDLFVLSLTMPPVSREALYESEELSTEAQDSAALLASKVYYYLGEYDEALSFALGAGNAFEAESRDYMWAEYVETVVCKILPPKLGPISLTIHVTQRKPLIGIFSYGQRNKQKSRTGSTPDCRLLLKVSLTGVSKMVNTSR